MIALSRNTDTATINKILTVLIFPLLSLLFWPSLILVSDIHLACNQGFYGCIIVIISGGGATYEEMSDSGRQREPIVKKTDRSLHEEGKGQNKNTNKIWCPEGGRYQYVEVCRVSCKKIQRCEAYADYREPKLI
jgi:hypothetical protein